VAILDHKIPPPIVGLLIAASMWGAAQLGVNFVLTEALKYGLSIGLLAVGLVFESLAVLAFRAQRTTVNPLKPERTSSMVVTGVYRISRNPMYVGMAFMLLGFAVYLGAWVNFAGPIAFVCYITQFQIKPEERTLTGLFGQSYVDYTAQVRRWL
jgi:protein-S-isoprenylcysteine O-methyltransferase Ste14